MKYYQTDESGFYVGEGVADESPLEPGVFLIPRGGVVSKPPAKQAGKIARLVAGAWSLVPDLRGSVYWLADGSRHEITEPGQALPAGALMAQPPKTQAQIDAEASAQAKAELAAIDLASIRSIREYIASKPDAPQILKDKEAAAVAARSRVVA